MSLAGQTNSNGANAHGAEGVLNSGSPEIGSAGLFGYGLSTNANGPGVYGQHGSVIGPSAGVLVETSSTSPNATGIAGRVLSTSPASGTAGERGINDAIGGNGMGVWGSSAGYGLGVYGSFSYGRGFLGQHTGVWGDAGRVEGATNSRVPNAVAVQGAISSSQPGSGATASAWGHGAGVGGSTSTCVPNAVGVQGVVASTRSGDGSAPVRGINGADSAGISVWGSQAGSGWGVYGRSPACKGVVGESAFAHPLRVLQDKPRGAQGTYLDPALYRQPCSKAETTSPPTRTRQGDRRPPGSRR